VVLLSQLAVKMEIVSFILWNIQMDRLDAMSVVVAVQELGSLSAAARHLRMPLPTVSRKVSDLEAHLNARLFNRSTRRMALTDAGESYIAACKRILDDVRDAEHIVSGEYRTPRGELVISAPIVFGRLHVLPTITAFFKAYPEVTVRLVLSDRLVGLLEDHVDLALRIGELVDSTLIATRCGSTRRVVCGSPDYFSEHGTPKHPTDLASHAAVVFETLAPSNAWVFATDRSEVAVSIRPKLIVNTSEAAIDAAKAGVGLTRVLSYQIEQAVKSGTLVAVLKRFEPASIPISIVYTNQRRLPLKVRAFLDFAAPRLRARLSLPR
jgi:DNA-binding transcriptional LysR family regulator